MAGYSDTRQMIIDTLMGRPAGTEIQPEDHQAFALQITDYVRSVELVAGNATPIGFADALTVPVQPDNGQVLYLSQVGRGTTVVFTNFIDQSGNAISVTSDSSSVTLVNLLWNGQYWTKQETRISLENTVQENDIADGAVTTDKIKDGAVTETKIADGSITGDKFSPGLTLYMNKQFNYLKQVQIKYGEDPSAEIKSFAQRDNKTALHIKLSNGLLVPANTNGETASGLYSYGNTVRKVLFDGTNWSDVEIQNDIIDTAHIKNDAVTTNKIEDSAVTGRKIANSAVLSKKLDQGARNAIILTPDTTEVYEAIYRKLLSEDVDVMFKTNTETVCTLADKRVYDDKLHLYFTNITCNGDAFNTNLYAVRLDIKATWPHSVLVNVLYDDLFSEFLDQSGYLNKSTLTPVPFTDTTLSNKAQLEVFLSKVPDATVMHCTYNEIWAGTLHKINGDWYGLLVKNTNSPADNINVKLSADGTIIKSNSAQ